MNQSNKKLLLGITGGIAAYKTAELTRLLIQANYDLQVVMTEAACHFITPVTLQALSGKPVYTTLWDTNVSNNMGHIDLSRDRDAILVAPASADFIAKITRGHADDLLTTLCLARECPLLIAPAMNRQMWGNSATQRNIVQLLEDGIRVLGPAIGDQACGEVGPGRMLEAKELFDEVEAFFQPKTLLGKKVLITAGSTFEAIDPVRGLTNLSSGKMGYAVARAAIEAGAQVSLVTGPTALTPPLHAHVVKVTSAKEMFDAVKMRAEENDIFISVAAVADYHVGNPSNQKIKKSANTLQLELTPNPDIIEYVAHLKNPPFCVGFAAESEKLNQHAEEKRRRKNLPLIVGNLVQNSIGTDEAELILFDDKGAHPLSSAPKLVLARQLMAHIAKMLKSS